MIDLIMSMIMGAGLTAVVGLVLLAIREEREDARERAAQDQRPGRHSLENKTRRIYRAGGPVRSGQRFTLEDGEGLVRPYVTEEGEDE